MQEVSQGETEYKDVVALLEIGILDNTYSQLRKAAYPVLLGNQSVDEAIAWYGKY